jgi:hypothetical protein
VALDQQPHQLALRQVDAEVLQQGKQTRNGGLALVILGEHEPFQLGPEVAGDPSRQRRYHGLARRYQPALAPVEHRQRPHHEVLDDKLLIALEACAGRHVLGLDGPGLVDRELRALGATTTDLARPLGWGLGRLLHAARLELGAAIEPLEPRHLLTQGFVLCLEPGNVLKRLHQQRLQVFEAKSIKGAG